MARLARIAVVNVPHHVTQRGNARQSILTNHDERTVYLNLLHKYIALCELSLLGYCLMSNHVHLLLVPRKVESLAQALKQAHGRYASYWNATHRSSGHVWQGRFYSCPLDDSHLWIALRYVELNPVRAALVPRAELWPWSSAAVHCGDTQQSIGLEWAAWNHRWSQQSWKEYLACGRPASRTGGRPPVHPHRQTAGPSIVRAILGRRYAASSLSPERRPPKSENCS